MYHVCLYMFMQMFINGYPQLASKSFLGTNKGLRVLHQELHASFLTPPLSQSSPDEKLEGQAS